MLRREPSAQQLAFADHARAALAVPEDHPLLVMKRVVEWEQVEEVLAPYYASGVGRPSWPPTVLLRMLFLEQWADLSDREVAEQVGYNLLYRAFVGLGIEDRVPDDTTLVTFRARLGEEGVEKVFEVLNARWAEAGLIQGRRRVVDGMHMWAKVARRSWISLLRQGRDLIVQAVEAIDPARGQLLQAEFVAPYAAGEERGEEGLRLEAERTGRLVEALRDLDHADVRQRIAQVETILKGEGDRVVSFDDPDARWGHKAPDKPFCGYKLHEAIDPDSRLITAVDMAPGNANEAVQTDVLLDLEGPTLPAGAVIIGDGLYNNATTVEQVEQRKQLPCFSGLQGPRVSDAFAYEADADRMRCAEGKHSIGKVRVDQGDLYYFSTRDCNLCPRRDTCLTPGEREGKAMPRRRVYLSDVRKKKVVAGAEGAEWRKAQLKVRGYIEAKFSEQANPHGLRRCRYWGRAKTRVQALLNASVVNLKRVVKLLHTLNTSPSPPLPTLQQELSLA